jgi:hypothetical protein
LGSAKELRKKKSLECKDCNNCPVSKWFPLLPDQGSNPSLSLFPFPIFQAKPFSISGKEFMIAFQITRLPSMFLDGFLSRPQEK